MNLRILIFLPLIFLFVSRCSTDAKKDEAPSTVKADSIEVAEKKIEKITADDVKIEKQLLYDKYTLEDSYPYKDTTRVFQWDKIKERLAHLENLQMVHDKWGILQNYNNKNGEAPLIKKWNRNVYKRVADTFGVERYQSVPLFQPEDSITGERYGRDGSLVKILEQDTTSNFIKVESTDFEGKWLVPKKYVKIISDTVNFTHAIVVDRNNENIVTLEKSGDKWLVRSMNPVTTGLHNPPYQQETPLGLFVIQEKKYKMFFLVDGTSKIAGFAPYANRFTNGGYLHGVPVNKPREKFIEYSASLGTTPRSHMCVRNATSHAEFIYKNFPALATVVFVIE